MKPIEIIVIVCACLIVVSVFGKMIYNRIMKKPPSECACCQKRMKRTLKKMKKDKNLSK